jgi:hypothetical protein
MRRGEKLIDDVRFDSELFAQLPSQRGFQRFSRFDFTARKFPQVRKVHVRRALRQQNVLVSMNDCCNDNDHKLFLPCGCNAPVVSGMVALASSILETFIELGMKNAPDSTLTI